MTKHIPVPEELLRRIDHLLRNHYIAHAEGDCERTELRALLDGPGVGVKDALEAENAELRKDAERYRYAAEHLWIGDVRMGRIIEEWGTIDIDAALAKIKEAS